MQTTSDASNGAQRTISAQCATENIPDSKVHGANMGPIWGRQDPGGPHVSPMNFVMWDGECWSQAEGKALETSWPR